MKKVIILILVISLFSCNSQKSIKADYNLNVKETFEITLKSNPTTGYSWKLIKNDATELVDSVRQIYKQDKSEPEMVGVGGKEIWKFQAKKIGVDTLIFEYCRSWESNSAVETKKVVIKIN